MNYFFFLSILGIRVEKKSTNTIAFENKSRLECSAHYTTIKECDFIKFSKKMKKKIFRLMQNLRSFFFFYHFFSTFMSVS